MLPPGMAEFSAQSNQKMLPRMAILLVASVLAGMAYNSFTAFGVNFRPVAQVQSSLSATTNQAASPDLKVTAPTKVVPAPANFAVAPEGAGPMPTPKHPIPTLTWAEVKPLLAANKITLVDARSGFFYKAGHIPGAVSVPSFSGYDLGNFADDRPRNEPIVVYCSNEHCPLSFMLAAKLINDFNFADVRIMSGGFDEYQLAEAGARKADAK
jgi:rhodanese-related sulfurtransferase